MVRHGGLDDAVGVVHLRDLVGVPDDRPVDECARPPLLLPDSLPVVDALRQFKAERQQIALVVDEHGAVDGIVTLEDLLEEIVGEIYDETDRDVQRGPHRGRRRRCCCPAPSRCTTCPTSASSCPAGPAGDYTTIAGLVLTCLGHIPTVAGESVTVDGWELAGDRHRPPGHHRGPDPPRTPSADAAAEADQPTPPLLDEARS